MSSRLKHHTIGRRMVIVSLLIAGSISSIAAGSISRVPPEVVQARDVK